MQLNNSIPFPLNRILHELIKALLPMPILIPHSVLLSIITSSTMGYESTPYKNIPIFVLLLTFPFVILNVCDLSDK